MSEYTGIVILCEDRQQEVFARHFLINCGVRKQRIYVNVAPQGAHRYTQIFKYMILIDICREAKSLPTNRLKAPQKNLPTRHFDLFVYNDERRRVGTRENL
jgi:hypothetical protein